MVFLYTSMVVFCLTTWNIAACTSGGRQLSTARELAVPKDEVVVERRTDWQRVCSRHETIEHGICVEYGVRVSASPLHMLTSELRTKLTT